MATYSYTLILLGMSVLIVALMRRMHLPSLLGYIVVGLLIGPHVFNLTGELGQMDLLVEIGLAFLLFMLGLEFSLARLMEMGRPLLILGSTQVVISTLAGMVIVSLVGLPIWPAIILGGAMALSSTAIGARELVENHESQKDHGRLSMSILLFQDLAAVLFLAAIPILGHGSQENLTGPLVEAAGKGLIAVIAVYGVSQLVMRPLFRMVAPTRAPELFTITALFAALVAAGISHLLGLSYALGAFLAGVMLGESEFRHQIESDIRPFRDVLMGLFFINVGLQLDPGMIINHWQWLLILVPGIIIGKGVLIALLTMWAKHSPGTGIRTGLYLGQGGEFGLAVLILAVQENLVSHSEIQPTFAAIGLSMLISPILIRQRERIVHKLVPEQDDRSQDEIDMDVLKLTEGENKGHVLICGYGHVGQNLATYLRLANCPFAALEYDPHITRLCRQAGEEVYYGDSTSMELLMAAGVMYAQALVISFNHIEAAEKIIRRVRAHRPEMPIIVRLADDRDFKRLIDAGATDIVPEYVEAGTTLATHLLGYLHVPAEDVMSVVEQARSDEYMRLRAHFTPEEENPEDTLTDWRRWTVVLTPGSYAIGHSIGSLSLPEGVYIQLLRRGQARQHDLKKSLVLEANDVLVLAGPIDKQDECNNSLLWGPEGSWKQTDIN